MPRIWGARTLAPLFPEKASLGEPIGEVWLTGNECRFADGPFAGERLGDAWPRMNDEWAGNRARRDKPFPVLAKFLFPADKLSVQVHPNNDYAMRHEAATGGTGKTEMWYVVSAQPGAEVHVGLKPAVSAEQFRAAIANNTAEDLLERIPVASGDTIFVPSRTVHTIGPGMVLCEIQQNSDITYRVFDFSRRDASGNLRELHIEKAFDVIRFGKQLGGKITALKDQDESTQPGVLVECPHFAVDRHVFATTKYFVKPNGRLELIIVLNGNGTLRTQLGDASVEYSRAQAWLVPGALRECVYEPNDTTTLLRVFVPGA
ncbi:MAG TPA: class I mannose-6-phosphate isomerase [Candidatus Acidoferrales bacterium]|nr:class I mannose-6-phosphate isomerase [Candidatus Acidoferrales bacterium]